MCLRKHSCSWKKEVLHTYACAFVLVRVHARACCCVCTGEGGGCAHVVLVSMQQTCAILWCNLCPLWLHHIFRHCLKKGYDFSGKNSEHKMCVLVFSTSFMWNIFHSAKNTERYCHKYRNVSRKVPVILVEL